MDEGTERGKVTAHLSRDLRIGWTLIGLAPVLLALATWTPTGQPGSAILWMRFLSPPVLAIEVAVIAIAIVHRFRPGAMIAALPRPARVAALAFPLLVLAGLLVAEDRGNALLRVPITLLHPLFGLAVAHLVSLGGGGRRLWRAIAAGAAGYLLLATLYVVAIPDWAAHNWLSFGLGVTNIRHAGFIAGTGAAAAIGLIAGGKGGVARLMGFGLAAAACAFLVWTGSRGGLVAILGGALATAAVVGTGAGVRLIGYALGAILAGTVIGAALPTPGQGTLGLGRIGESLAGPNLSSGRLALWSDTIDAIASKPLLGHGEVQFFGLPLAQGQWHHPHNVVLQILFQWGLTGLLIVGTLATLMWLRMLRVTRADPDRLMAGFLIANTLLVYSLYDGILFFVMPAMMLVTACAAVAGVASGPRDRYLARR